MRITYSSQADAVLVELDGETPVASTRQLSPLASLDLDAGGGGS